MTSAKRIFLSLLLGGVSVMGSVAAQEPAGGEELRLDVTRYRIEGDTPLSEAGTAALLAPFVGAKRRVQDIEQAARALEKHLSERGYAFHRVFVPAQKPAQGEVVLKVIRFNLADVTVSGNEHFSAGNIRHSLPALQPGAAPAMASVGRDLSAANANPAKQVAITFREGKKPETIDAEIRVKDANPLSVFAGLTSNRSVDPVHRADNLYRMTLGVQHSNLFDLDHVATLSYTTDPEHLSKVTLLGAYYQLPIYGSGLNLSGYYTHSDVNSGRVQQGAGFFDLSGRGEFYGVRLTQALPRLGTLQQTLSVALDERYFENNTTFAGVQVQPDVSSLPLSAKYAVHQDQPWGVYGANLEYLVNLKGGSANSAANYRQNGGDQSWDAWRFMADISRPVGTWNLAGRLRGQWSTHKLISGEQLGLGGANSVRGFADREVAGDYGYLWNIEAKGGAMLLPQLRPVLFVDGGAAHSRATRHTEYLMSAGAGLRWSSQQFEAALDLAQVVDRNDLNPEKTRLRLTASLFYRF